MGIPRPKRMPHGRVPRPTVTNYVLRKPVGLTEVQWQAIMADQPAEKVRNHRLLVWLDASTHKARRAIRAMLHATGAKIHEQHGTPRAERTAYVLSGCDDTLNRVLSFSICHGAADVTSARVGRQAQGSGPEKVKASAAKESRPQWRGEQASEHASMSAARECAAHTSCH